MKWIIANWDSVLIIITSIVTTASIIAKATKNETANKYVFYALKLVDLLAMSTNPTKLKKF